MKKILAIAVLTLSTLGLGCAPGSHSDPPRPAVAPGTHTTTNTPGYPEGWDCDTMGDRHCGDLELGA